MKKKILVFVAAVVLIIGTNTTFGTIDDQDIQLPYGTQGTDEPGALG